MLVFKLRYFSSAILREFDTRFHFLKKGITAIELGPNKGDWSKYISSKINSESSTNLFAIGDQEITEIIPGMSYIKGEISNPKTLITLQKELLLNPVDLLISNLQPKLENDRDLDNFAQIEINKQVLKIALKTLKTGGVMLMRAREGEPEKLFYKYLRLYFKDFYQITPTVEPIASGTHYYLGSGFKMKEELQKYQSFFHKIQNNEEEDILEEEIPPTYQTAADRDLEVLEFLDYVSTHQIAITQEYVDSVKQHPRFKTLNWDKYILNIVSGPLTDFQEEQVFYAKYAGRLSFAPNMKGIDEEMIEADQQIQKYDEVMNEKDTSKSLLGDDEVLGQNPSDFDGEFQKLKQEFLKIQEQVKDGTFMEDIIDETEREGAQKYLDEEGLKYVQTNYKNKPMKDVIQGEIDKGVITKEELNQFFDIDDQQLMEKVNDDYNQCMAIIIHRKYQQDRVKKRPKTQVKSIVHRIMKGRKNQEIEGNEYVQFIYNIQLLKCINKFMKSVSGNQTQNAIYRVVSTSKEKQSEDGNIPNSITRTFTIRNKKYTYNGPVNKEIDQLLLDLQGSSGSGEMNGIVAKIDNFDKNVEFRLSYQNIKISAGGIIVTIVYWSAYFATLSESITLLSDSEISTNRTKQDIVSYLPLYCFLYTLFTQILQQIKSMTIWIALFPFLVITPLLVLFDYHLNLFNSHPDTNYDYQGMAFVILTMSIYVNSLLTRLIINWFTKQLSYFIANIMATQFCLLIAYGIVFKLIIYIIATHTYTVNNITQDIRDIIAPPLFFIMLYVSIAIIYRLFQKQPKLIMRDLEILKFKKKNIEVEENQDSIQTKFYSFLDRIHFKWIAPSTFVLLYTILELYAYGSLISEMSQNTIVLNRVVGFGFLVGFIPLFIIFGIIISSSRTQFVNINLWVPLILGAGFSILTIKLWGIFSNLYALKSVAQLVGICPLIVCVIWISVSYFRSERNILKIAATTLCCYFLAFPLGFLITLSFIYDDNSYSQAGYIMIYVGILIFALFIIYFCVQIAKNSLKLPEQSRTLNFKEYMYYNLKDYATWLNSICFMISFFLICYFVWNIPTTATGTKKGAMQGLLVLHPILFILINVVLRLKSVDEDSEVEIEIKDKKKQLKIQQLITFCTLVPFIVLLPIGLTQDDETTKNTLITVAIGVPIVFQMFSLFLYIKNQSINYQNFFQPFIIILCWAFVIAPFGVIMPILADYYENSSSNFAIFAQAAIAFGLIVCILGVTGTSLFFSWILNKEYLELKKREVLKSVMGVLTENQVSSDQDVCSLMFMRYVRENDPKKLLTDMQRGDPVNVLDYHGTHMEVFKKVLVNKREYEDFYNLNQEQNQDNQDVSRTTEQKIVYYIKCIAKIFLDICFCKCGLEDLERSEELLRQKEVELQLLEEQLQQQLNKGKLKLPDNDFNKRLHRNKFYCALQINPDKVAKFWQCLFCKYQNNLADLFELLDIQLEEQELYSYSISNGNIRLSENDFAEILKLYIIEDGQKIFTSLQMLALRKYPLFVYNFKDLEQMLNTPSYEETAFSMKNFQKIGKMKIKNRPTNMKKKKTIIKPNNNFNQEEYIQKKEMILTQYNQKPCLQSKVKLYKIFKCLNEWIWVKPMNIASLLLTKLFQELNFQIIPQTNKSRSKIYTSWEQIASESSTVLVKACQQFDQDMLNKEFLFKMNFTNILTFFLRIYDIYGLATLAFDSQVGWFGQNQTFDPISTVDGSAIFSSYNFYFFIALAMCIIYAILGREAVSQISNDTFGFDEHANPISWTHPRFWLSKVIILISGQFIFVMKTFIDAFICDYTNYPYTLVRSPSLECMSDLHFMYVILAFFGAFIYYPLSTFLQPTFQFADHSLDLKYQSTYIVIYIQAKLLILGISSVFSNLQAQAYQYQMLFASIIMLLLIIVYLKMMPCYVKWFNTVELTLYGIVFNCYFGAFLILLTGSKQVGWVYTGIAIGLILMYLIYWIKYKQDSRNRVKPEENSGLIRP